jgi:TRAP-type mannitol/chloroaromatic compound transport system substrate-binding protein
VCQAITTDVVADYVYNNAVALQQLMEDPEVEVRPYPDDVLALLKSITLEIVDEMSVNDPMAAKIQKSYYDFLDISTQNQRISEHAFLETRAL